MRKILNRKTKKVKKSICVVTNCYGSSGLVYTDESLAWEFCDRMDRKYPENGPWLVNKVKVLAYQSESDYDLVYEYLRRKKKVNSRTPKNEIIQASIDYFSRGNYALKYNDSNDKWVVKNKLTGRTYAGTMPLEAIQRMLRASVAGKVSARSV